MRRQRHRSAAVAAVVLGAIPLLAPGALHAQDPTVTLTGVVRDSAGLAIDGAIVEARETGSGFVYRTAAGTGGTYGFDGLRAGTYDIRASRVGHTTVVREGAVLRTGANVRLDFDLPPGAVELETIVVVQPLLESTADVGFAVDPDFVRNIPDASRRMTELALLVPGAVPMSNGPPGVGSDIALGGLNSNSTAVRLDGGSLNEPAVRNAYSAVPRLAVEELQVLTTSYAAEFGQTASGTINASSRRGTNEWEGEGFVLTRNQAWTATDPFALDDPDFRHNVFGVALGGPIRRDRTHVFAAIEATDELLSGILNTGGVYPEYDGTYDLPGDEQLVLARVDHRLSDAHELMARYSGGFQDRREQIGPSWHCAVFDGAPRASPNFGVDAHNATQSFLLRHRWVTGEGSLNQASIHYLRSSDYTRRLTKAPAFQYPGLCDGGNFFDADGDAFRLELEDTFAFALSGRYGDEHRMKVGVRVSFTGSDRVENTFSEGRFVFDADHGTEATFFNRAEEPLVNDERNTQIGVFWQDEMRPIPDLTFTLGLRYDIETNGSNQDFVGPGAGEIDLVRTTPRPVDGDNLAPRLSVAWDAGGAGRTILRGGFGIFYDQHWLWRSAFESGLVGIAAMAPGTLNPDEVMGRQGRRLFPLGAKLPTPYTSQASVGIEHALPADLVVRLDGLLVQGRNLPVTAIREVADHAPNPDPSEPGIALIQTYENTGRAEAKMLMFYLGRQGARGGFGVAYTLADRKTTVDSWFAALDERAATVGLDDELAPTSWDERHRIVLSGWTRLPTGLQAGTRVIYASARPYTVFDTNGDRIGARNGARGADFFTADLGLTWTLPIAGARFGVALNLYNLFNRTNYDPTSYIGRMGQPDFGEPTAALPGRQLELGVQAGF